MTERRARGEVNVPPPSPGRSYRRIFFENVFSFINNVFYVLCLMLVILGRPMDALLPLAVVLINAGLSVFQEVRAKRKLNEIALLTRPTAKVVRDGQGALIQQTNAIESLSNVDMFCLDKTGTLTTNRLRVEDVRPLGIDRDDHRARLSDFVASATTTNKTSEAIAATLPGRSNRRSTKYLTLRRANGAPSSSTEGSDPRHRTIRLRVPCGVSTCWVRRRCFVPTSGREQNSTGR